MKKVFALILTLATLLVLVACGEAPIKPTEAEATAEPDECALYGHEYMKEVVKPTCSAEGYTKYTCIHCGNTYISSYTPKIKHTQETVPAVAATCTSDGLTEGKRCSVCGEILTPQEVIPKTAHTEMFFGTVLPTTTSDGRTYGAKCSVCGEILIGNDTIHKLTESAQSTATDLPLDFNEFKENINETRRENAENFEFPELPIFTPEYVEPALTDEEARTLATKHNEKSAKKEQAIQDVDVFFRALKDSYACYYLFGEEKFLAARDDIINELESLQETELISPIRLYRMILERLDLFVADLHFPHVTQDYVQYYYYYAHGLFLHKDTRGYYLKNGDDKWYFESIDGDADLDEFLKVTISPEGELVYTLGHKYLLVDESPKPAHIVLSNGNTKVNYGINWTLSETRDGLREKVNSVFSSSIEDGYNVIRVSRLPDPQSGKMIRFKNTATTLKGENNLILDFRGNGGGDNGSTLDWLRFFSDDPEGIWWPSAIWNIESPLVYYCYLAKGYEIPFENSGKYIAHGWEYYYDHTIAENDNAVFWLTDNQCGSSGDTSIRPAQEFENMIVIGTHTMGCAGVGGEWFSIYLPNTGLEFSYRADLVFDDGHSIHGTGFDPDIWVPSEYALELTIKLCEYYGLEPGEKKVETYGTAPARVSLDGYAGY